MKPAPAETDFIFGPYRLDVRTRRLICRDMQVQISRSEYLLLRMLSLHRGEVVSRRQLMQAVWGITVVSHGALDTLVNTLREKLDAEQPGLIESANGVGFLLVRDTALQEKETHAAEQQSS